VINRYHGVETLHKPAPLTRYTIRRITTSFIMIDILRDDILRDCYMNFDFIFSSVQGSLVRSLINTGKFVSGRDLQVACSLFQTLHSLIKFVNTSLQMALKFKWC